MVTAEWPGITLAGVSTCSGGVLGRSRASRTRVKFTAFRGIWSEKDDDSPAIGRPVAGHGVASLLPGHPPRMHIVAL